MSTAVKTKRKEQPVVNQSAANSGTGKVGAMERKTAEMKGFLERNPIPKELLRK